MIVSVTPEILLTFNPCSYLHILNKNFTSKGQSTLNAALCCGYSMKTLRNTPAKNSPPPLKTSMTGIADNTLQYHYFPEKLYIRKSLTIQIGLTT